MTEIVAITDDHIFFRCDTKNAVRLGAHFVQGQGCWRLPINLHTITDLTYIIDDARLKELLTKVRGYYQDLKQLKSLQDIEGDNRLRPYQRVDSNFLRHRQSVGVFNEQRTGKTPTTLISAKERFGKNLIVCPSGLKLNWEREIATWVQNKNVLVVQGTPTQRTNLYKRFVAEKEATLIMSYETLRQDFVTIKPLSFDVLIVDEAHRLRNYQTKQSKAILEVSKNSKYVYTLTGTPAVNHPSDVFGIFKVLRPSKYTSYWEFVERYFGTYDTMFGKEVSSLRKDRKHEFTDLLDIMSVQRKRKEVMKWLPKLEHRVIELEQTKEQAKYTKEIVELSRFNGEVIPNAIAALMRLRQTALDTRLIGGKEGSPKEDFVLEYIEDNPDDVVIVFSMFTSFLNNLYAKLKDVAVMLTGEQSQAQKQFSVDSIQQGRKKVLLANIVAGGTGWTLDRASTIIFTDISYTPIENEQARDRFVPTNPDVEYEPKQVIYLQSKNSIDKNMETMVKNKVNIIKFVNDYGVNAVVNYNPDAYNNSRKE